MNIFARLYAFWIGIPAPMRAPLTVAVLTGNTVFCTVMGIAYGDHAFDPPSALWPWITAHGLGACVGAFIGYATSTTVRTSQVLKNNPIQTTPPPPPQEK